MHTRFADPEGACPIVSPRTNPVRDRGTRERQEDSGHLPFRQPGSGHLLVPATSASSSVRHLQERYDNRTELNRDYKHGISNRHFTKRQWICRGATGKGAYRPRLYRRVESSMDRDNDHIACEKWAGSVMKAAERVAAVEG